MGWEPEPFFMERLARAGGCLPDMRPPLQGLVLLLSCLLATLPSPFKLVIMAAELHDALVEAVRVRVRVYMH